MDDNHGTWRTPRMTVWIIRSFFLLIAAGMGWVIGEKVEGIGPFWGILGTLALYFVVLALELILGTVSNISALAFGVVVGVILGNFGYMLASLHLGEAQRQQYGDSIRLILICMFSYLTVVLIFKTRDRFNFIIPFVEFQRQQRGASSVILDTSAIIDGRIADVLETGVIDLPVVIPRFVIDELQALADSANRLKRTRARRGLDVLQRLRSDPDLEVRIDDSSLPGPDAVDARLVRLASALGARLATTDFNLQKVATLNRVNVLNLNDLSAALRPSVLPGEELTVELVREGEEPGQAVGFLDDGTMIIAEQGKEHIGRTVELTVARVLQMSSGRMIFGRIKPGEREQDRR